MTKRLTIYICLFAVAVGSGCADPKEQYGRTWYIDGAGNWGFGAIGVPVGLKKRGYRGVVSNHRWSLTFNPALDQTLRFIAKGSSKILAGDITNYLKRNPDADANIIALSAGTGVGIWAIEQIKPPYKVNNFIMTGSSLSSRYDVRRALANMKGNIYCYYSASDPVLQGPVRALGTIDGTFQDSAGLVGLRGPGAAGGRVKNIGRSAELARLGWTGGHADCVTERFVAGEIYKHIVSRPAGAPRDPENRYQAPGKRRTAGADGTDKAVLEVAPDVDLLATNPTPAEGSHP